CRRRRSSCIIRRRSISVRETGWSGYAGAPGFGVVVRRAGGRGPWARGRGNARLGSSSRPGGPVPLDPTGRVMAGFEFQRLRVFDAAANAAAEVSSLARRIPVAHRALRDQISRSSTSVALHIAEGADEFRPAEKVRFYRVARRSAGGPAGARRLRVRLGLLPPEEPGRALTLLEQAAAALPPVMTSVDRRTAPPAGGPGPRAPGPHHEQ